MLAGPCGLHQQQSAMSSQTQRTFVQFRYCPLCRLNHKKGKKHVHSKRHQEIVTNILKKFLIKITTAKSTLERPSVREMIWEEASQNFWCYFCQLDVLKHKRIIMTQGECVVEHGGLLEHITRDDHVENATKFLRENKLDLKRTPEFMISSQVYLKYLEATEPVCTQFFMRKAQVLGKMAAQIRTQNIKRHKVVTSGLLEQNLRQQGEQQLPPSGSNIDEETLWLRSRRSTTDDTERGRKTIQAFGEGLTAIDRSNEDDSAGNIYSNAVPPWMQADKNEESTSGVIGPTIADLEKHRKLEKKRQLPAGRVGAKFDHKMNQSESWLPDFGGVWSHGRRTNSAQQFHRRRSQKPGFSTGTSTETTPVSAPSSTSLSLLSSVQTSHYSLPKIPKTTSTVTSFHTVSCTSSSFHNHDQMETAQNILSSKTHDFQLPPSHLRFSNLPQDFPSHTSDFIEPAINSDSLDQFDSGYVDANASLTLKPYVRKRKSSTFSESQHSLSSSAFHSSEFHVHPVGQRNGQNVPNEFSQVWPSVSHNYGIHSDFMIESNTPSSFSDISRESLNSNCVPYHRQRGARDDNVHSSDNRDFKQKGPFPFRLLATPVINQGKK